MKKTRYLLFPLLLVLTLFVVLRETGITQIGACLTACSLRRLLPAIGCMLLFVLCEAANLKRCLQLSAPRHESSLICGSENTDAETAAKGETETETETEAETVSFRKQAIPYALAGFFFSGITPFSSGGQPMQLYAMHRDGISTARGTVSLAMELASFQAASVTLAGAGLLYFHTFILERSGFAASLLLLGFAANLALLSLLLLAIFVPSSISRITDAIAALLQKLHFAKAAQFCAAADNWAADYQGCAACLRGTPQKAVLLFATSLLQLSAMHSIPYWVALSLGVHSVTFLQVTALQAVLFLVVSLIPLPGGTGASEGGFLLLYTSVFTGGALETAMLLSRFASFYLPLLVSGLLLWAKSVGSPLHRIRSLF